MFDAREIAAIEYCKKIRIVQKIKSLAPLRGRLISNLVINLQAAIHFVVEIWVTALHNRFYEINA
jgi:hypothetical protein